MFRSIAVALLLLSPAVADDFHVRTDGRDEASRDGRAADAAWGSLAYACERVPEGEHTIHLGPGTFTATGTARPRSGVTIAGSGHAGKDATRIVAETDWGLSPEPCKADVEDEYLIVIAKQTGVVVRDLLLSSHPEHRITGGVLVKGSKDVELARLYVRDFRWNGLNLQHSHELEVHHCRVENASTDKCRYHGGLVRTRWIKHSTLHHNDIVSDIGGGYGYKGGGHERVRLHHNFFDVAGGFSIESAHENEYGLEIDHNYCNRCISVPKGGQGANPNDRDCEYSVHIHHNLLVDSYTVEGPRNHLRVDHNWIRIERPNGRVYTHHGGVNHGPVTIDHNVVENLDRAFIWMNNGLAENITVTNNTVFCADAGERTGSILGAYTAERLNDWVVRDNVFVCPNGRPRKLFDVKRGVPTKITATGNVCVNVTGVPDGNTVTDDPGLRLAGEKPWPWFAPREAGTTAGAYAFDEKTPFPDVPAGNEASADR